MRWNEAACDKTVLARGRQAGGVRRSGFKSGLYLVLLLVDPAGLYLGAASDADRRSYRHPQYRCGARFDGSGFPSAAQTLGSARSTRRQFEGTADTAHPQLAVPLVARLP